jgi:predicted transcriptional regulator
LTIEKLADAVGISPRSVKRHLSGDAAPRPENLGAYEQVFSEKLKRQVRFQNVPKTSP